MAITQTYVDPSIAAPSGSGSIGDPWGDIQHALDTIIRDATDGDQLNIKAGTDERLAASLDLSTYGTPSAAAPLIFRGYTSAANDGGIGGIDCNSYSMFADTAVDFIILVDLHIHNGGSANLVDLDNEIAVINCEVNNTSGIGITIDGGVVLNCHVHDIGDRGVAAASSLVAYNYFENGTKAFDEAIFAQVDTRCMFNIINIDGNSIGISLSNDNASAINNTIYSNAGTNAGIKAAQQFHAILNNYIEGFSGVGGEGIDIDHAGVIITYIGNRFYNNTTHETKDGNVVIDSDNSAVGSSALTNPGGGDFSAGTDLKAGAWPSEFPEISQAQYLDIGAVQREEPSGGGGGIAASIFGGLLVR